MSDDPAPTPPSSGGGGATAGGCVSGCPCATDFDLDAPCRIVKSDGGVVTLTAREQGGNTSGSFAWTTASAKLRLTNAASAAVTVEGLASVSAGRDAETVTVTRSQNGCADIVKTVDLTVARLKFLASTNQRYGFDDFDTPANHDDDHFCVKRSDHTFVRVLIEGGATSDDFDFETDPATRAAAAAAPAGQADFDLRIDGDAHDKADFTLRARVKCPSRAVFRQIAGHVYKEREVKAVVAKIHDSRVAGSALRSPTADYAGHQATINAKVKEAVAKFDLSNFDAGNAQSDVPYDLDGNGALSYDIAASGGAELAAISTAIAGARTAGRIRIAIVRAMKSFYYLSSAAAIGDATITVRGGVFHATATTLTLGSGAGAENVRVASNAGTTLTLAAPLTKAHAVGAPLEYQAGGWSSDPILIIEGAAALNTIKWTIAHEAGHRAAGLNLTDINDAADFMHYNQSWTDYRLRYCPRAKYRGGGTENQWDTIPRT